MENLAFIIIVSLLVVCFVEFVKYMLECAFKEEKKIVILPLKTDIDKLDALIDEDDDRNVYYILNLDLSEDDKEYFEQFCNRNSHVKIYCKDGLEDILSKRYTYELADKFSIS